MSKYLGRNKQDLAGASDQKRHVGGLHLLIQPHGSKLWRMAYRFGGKQRTLALGIYPIVGLQEACGQRDAAKRLLAKGIDPSALRRLETQTAASGNTFKAVAEEVLGRVLIVV